MLLKWTPFFCRSAKPPESCPGPGAVLGAGDRAVMSDPDGSSHFQMLSAAFCAVRQEEPFHLILITVKQVQLREQRPRGSEWVSSLPEV